MPWLLLALNLSLASAIAWLLLERRRHIAELARLQSGDGSDAFVVRSQLEICSTGLAILSPELTWRRANPLVCELLGYSEAELQTRDWFSLTHPDDIAESRRHCARLQAGEIDRCDINQRFLRRDGSSVWVQVSATCERRQGEPSGYVVNLTDASEYKDSYSALARLNTELEARVTERTVALEESRQQLATALAAAEAANLAKSVFLANMSHELRTPLNAVIGFSRLMSELPSLSEEEVRNLEIINRAGNHLLSLINDVLEISKIEAGRVQLREDTIDLRELLDDIDKLLGERATSAGLRLELRIADEGEALPECIGGDNVKLRQILINLIGNAIKFTPSGSVTLTVRCRTLDGQSQIIDFSVHDTGQGISAEDQQRIFEPFTQLANDERGSGTGLGLTISRQYLRLMGSELEVNCPASGGTTFAFRLPVIRPTLPLTGRRPRHLHPVLTAADRGRKLLIAEDTPEARLLLRCLLEPMGFSITEAVNGEEAMRCNAEFAPELILMDWRMPILDGVEATRRIRASSAHQPKIIMLSANAFEENRLNALAAGADDYLRKPLDQEDLYDMLEAQLGVRFAAEQPLAANTAPESLSADELRLVPAALLDDLKHGVMQLNQARILDTLASLALEQPELAQKCRHLAEEFSYQPLWQWLSSTEADGEDAKTRT